MVELKVINISILFDAALCVALWQRDPAFLQAIPYQDLRYGFAVGFGELGESGIVCFLVANYWRIGFDDDFVLVAVIDNGALLTEGMKLMTSQRLKLESNMYAVTELIVKREKQVAEAGERKVLKSESREEKPSGKEKDSPRAD